MAPAAGNGGLREECEPAGQNSAAREGGSRLVARWWGEEEEDKLARPGKSGDLYVSCFFFLLFCTKKSYYMRFFSDVILIHE
jgi:hypothetical protein